MSYDSTQFLVTLDEMIDFLAIEEPTQEQENQIGFMLNMLSEFCDNYTNRDLLAADHTERLNGTGTQVLALSNYPINSTSSTISAYIDPDWEFTADDKVDADDIYIDSENGMIVYKDGIWTRGLANIKVIYNAGYESVPYDLQLSIQEAVAYFWERKEQKLWAKSSVSKGDTSVTRITQSLPDTVTAVWDRYRRIR
jgi:phosphoribosyl-AMP cyclohydrolase